MHAWGRWALLFVLLALSASVIAPARAEFPERCTPEYLALFDERLRGIEYDCVERLREPINTGSGQRHIRILHDFNADWIISSGEIAEFDRGVRSSIAAIDRIGGIDLEDVTVLLADDFPPREDGENFSDIAAYTETVNDGECRVIVYLVGPASRPEYAAWLLAHELFHCVQAANLSEAQLASPGGMGEGGGGNWWLEGSANWFAALAVPEIGPLDQFVDGFDAASSATPLNEMAYEAVVFFLWYGAESSPPGVMNFLRGMAESSAASAQRAAMISALPQDRWLDFAQAYLDREIRHPHGADLGLDPAQGDVWTWSETRTQNLALEPFVLARGIARFDCGRWRTSVRPDSVHRARPEDGAEWSELPASIETASGSGGSYRVVAISASASPVSLAIGGTMESGCGACLGVTETDACLVGAWQLTGGGATEWMRAQGIPGAYSTSNQSVTFRRDGSYLTSAMSGQSDVTIGATRGQGRMSAQASGRWSAHTGSLNMCADAQALSGRATVTGPSGRRELNVRNPGPGDLQMSYTCAGGTLTTIQPMPRGMPPMTSIYARTTE